MSAYSLVPTVPIVDWFPEHIPIFNHAPLMKLTRLVRNEAFRTELLTFIGLVSAIISRSRLDEHLSHPCTYPSENVLVTLQKFIRRAHEMKRVRLTNVLKSYHAWLTKYYWGEIHFIIH